MDQVKEHLALNDHNNRDQHRRQKGHSTTTCVSKLLKDNCQTIEAGLMTAIIAIDIYAAFDLVEHRIL